MKSLPGVLTLISVCWLLLAAGGCEPPAQKPLPFDPSTEPPPLKPRRPLTGDPQSEARQILLEGLADIDPRVRANAVEVIATVREVRLLPKIQRMLHDPAVQVRFLAALAIGDLRYALGKEEVTTLLNDPDANVRMAAAYALTQLGQDEYFPSLRDGIASKDPIVRANAALLLGKSGRQEALPLLYWTLQQGDSTDRVLLQAVESIAMLGDTRIYRRVWTRLISAYADDRMIGVSAMGALGTEEAKNALITMLDDTVIEVRLAAAEQLGKLGNASGAPRVAEVFDGVFLSQMDPQSATRIKVLAALAIGEIGLPGLVRHLPDLLQDPSQTVRLAAAKAILRTSAPATPSESD
jgi:HEAT repeat protein